MTDASIGSAMKLCDGSLSIIVTEVWKGRLVEIIRRHGLSIVSVQPLMPIEDILIGRAADNRARQTEFEVITHGEERDFQGWAKEICGR